MGPQNILNQIGRGMFRYLEDDLSYQLMNEHTHTASPQELIICNICSEEDDIILAFTYRRLNSSNKNSEYFNITLKCLSENFPSRC